VTDGEPIEVHHGARTREVDPVDEIGDHAPSGCSETNLLGPNGGLEVRHSRSDD
jgi:hypothetical protein